MSRKYQIFVSSTYEDLKEERDVVIKAILEMGHIPLGMEMFSAGDSEQWDLIKKQIDDSDYYVVIVAHRYGSLDGDISYTEKEYDYAKSRGIPVLGFVIAEDAGWDRKKTEEDEGKKRRLVAFKDKIKTKLVSFWSDQNDLYGKVSISLMKQFNTNPRLGWVRASEDNSHQVLAEVSRLSKENSELREQIESFRIEQKDEEAERVQRVIDILSTNEIYLSFWYEGGTDWENEQKFLLHQIFTLIAPRITHELPLDEIIYYVGWVLNPDRRRELREENPIARNTMEIILADLSLLELIVVSPFKHSLKDKRTYWSLSEFGRKVYKQLREEVLLGNLKNGVEEDAPSE